MASDDKSENYLYKAFRKSYGLKYVRDIIEDKNLKGEPLNTLESLIWRRWIEEHD